MLRPLVSIHWHVAEDISILLLLEACSYATPQKPFRCFQCYGKSADIQSICRILHFLCLLFSVDATKKLAFVAPRWGGFWERLIGLVKRTLRKTLGKTSLNYEEMYTVLCDCESLINSRPLTYVTDDVEDLEPLTPSMFLQDIREVGVLELDQIDDNKLNKRLVYTEIEYKIILGNVFE
ncbi:integrase catalytic domain-containing protein [Trichonephila clavipes]|uniref:Integrase catalytic domain-containing protein n=1 Tax=Trichonephila clavipes TaxID=2585209 RepID=A0A8X6RJV0_TRICX|nr:integrase catalytic domain-containing protein [Trichonephila clavipes]